MSARPTRALSEVGTVGDVPTSTVRAAMTLPDSLTAGGWASEEQIDRQMRAAYGDRPPGSNRRWQDQAPERAKDEQARRTRQAFSLWRRIHPDAPESQPIDLVCYANRRARSEDDPDAAAKPGNGEPGVSK